MNHKLYKGLLPALLAVVLLVVLASGIAACGSDDSETTTTAGEPQELTVSAASSLKAAFTDIAAKFDEANNCTTTLNFDSSGTLQEQIEAGAPVDVFASAAPKQMNALKDKSMVDADSIQVFASNEIVLGVPAASTLGVARFEDLAKPEVTKVAYGDPASVPHGTYAEEVLTTLGILDQVKPKVIYTTNATQTLEYVSSGEVDAAMMFSTDAIAGGEDVKLVATADPSQHSEILYPLGVITASTNKTVAQTFVDFVMSDEGQAILAQYGFIAPPAE